MGQKSQVAEFVAALGASGFSTTGNLSRMSGSRKCCRSEGWVRLRGRSAGLSIGSR